MFNINKNKTLGKFQELAGKTFPMQYSRGAHDFNDIKKSMEYYQSRVVLESTIEETISFNRKLAWEDRDKNLKMAVSAEELLEVFKLRSDIYTGLNYNSEFPEAIEGLNFDLFDKNSAILYTKVDNEVTGTCRLIFDSQMRLPIEQKYPFDHIRQNYGKIAEVSRLMVKHRNKGLNLEFKKLTKGIYDIISLNAIDLSISVIKKDHLKLYSRFGGFEIERELNSYGHLKAAFVLTSWDHSKITGFFKRAFLA